MQSSGRAVDPANMTNDEFFAPYDFLSPKLRRELGRKRDAGHTIHFVSNLVELKKLYETRYGNGIPISIVLNVNRNEVGNEEFHKMNRLMKRWIRSTPDNGPFPDGTICMGCCKSISLARGEPRLRCPRCRRSYFCSQECFARNWEKHKKRCDQYLGDEDS